MCKEIQIDLSLSLFCSLFVKTLNRRSESRSHSHSLCVAREGRIVACFCDVWVNNACIQKKKREREKREKAAKIFSSSSFVNKQQV